MGASHGFALGLLDGCMPWISSMASSCGDHHGHHMDLHWDSWMGACHGYLPWQAHVEITMGITWNCIGTPGWVHAMDIFHGMHPSRSPNAIPCDAHGDLHMSLPWKISMACTHPGVPMQFHVMPMVISTCACHGRYPWHAPIQESQ